MKTISTYISFGLAIVAIMGLGCKTSQKNTDATSGSSAWWENASEGELLDSVQRQTFRYFWEHAEPSSGLARERFHPDGDYPMNDSHIITTGGTGFGLMGIVAAMDRGFISREAGMQRLAKIVTFLEGADRYHGVWAHWIDGETGKTKPFSKKDDGGDLVETSFLVAGLLVVAEYCDPEDEAESNLAARIDKLWRGVEWSWHTQNQDVLYWHWSPNYAWDMNFAIHGYNECLITYVLAACSPTHPTDASVYHNGWAKGGNIVAQDSFYGRPRVLDHYDQDASPVGPLFWAHYSYLGLDPRELTDQYADYWQLNRNHALGHYDHCVQNPNGFAGYGPQIWGLTSSYSTRRNGEPGVGYTSHRPDRDKGVITPTAALSSMPYTPQESMQAVRGFYQLGDRLLGPAGFYDAFSEELDFWPQRYLAIDQGPIMVMIENHRSGLIWDLFMQSKDVQQGLAKLGFSY